MVVLAVLSACKKPPAIPVQEAPVTLRGGLVSQTLAVGAGAGTRVYPSRVMSADRASEA